MGQQRGALRGRSDHLRCRHRHDRGQGHRARCARPARHLGRAVRAARRGERQRRHDRAEHIDRGHHRHQLHDADGRPRAVGVDRAAGRRRDRRHRGDPRRRHRQGVARRCGHEVVTRHRGEDVPGARRRGRQHPDDLDVDDPCLDHHSRPATWSVRPARCTPRSGWTRAATTARRSPSASSRSGVRCRANRRTPARRAATSLRG